jgi:hypothetical protein
MPVYFVLGNHDYYSGSIAQVRVETQDRTEQTPWLHWLSGKAIRLIRDTWLIGSDGWGDGRAGSGAASTVRLNDSSYIAELRGFDGPELFTLLNELGDESCRLLQQALAHALEHTPATILIATHVPPFHEASLYRGMPSGPGFAPHFVNLGMGRLLRKVARQHPQITFRVYCGHTNYRASCQPELNLWVETAGSDYRAEISQILEV